MLLSTIPSVVATEAFQVAIQALGVIASWPEGVAVDSTFDEPHAARKARTALAQINSLMRAASLLPLATPNQPTKDNSDEPDHHSRP